MSRQLQIPQYTTGTVAVTGSSGNWTLAGTGTVWTSPDGVTQWTIAVGDIVVIPSANAFGFVGAINSNTSISLAYWSGSTVSAGASYVINRLTGLPSAAAAGLVQSLLALGSTSNPFAALSALVGSGKINFTTDGSNNIILQVRTASGYTDSNYVTAFTINPLTGIVTQAGSRTTVNDINYSALTTDRLIAYTAITAARTVTLPSAASTKADRAPGPRRSRSRPRDRTPSTAPRRFRSTDPMSPPGSRATARTNGRSLRARWP